MIKCKHCGSTKVVKNGFVRKKQRYFCKSCSRNFVIGDGRRKESVAIKKALCVILYSLGKASFGFLAKLFGVSRSLTYRWVKSEAESLPEPKVSNNTNTDLKFLFREISMQFSTAKKQK